MTEKELRRLSRVDLLEIMVEQGKELEKVKAELEAQKSLLQAREIKIEKAGSLAEASFAINEVIEAADAAAKQYLDNLQNMNESQEEYSTRRQRETEEKCAAVLKEAQEQADLMTKDARYFCEQMKANVEEYCLGLKADADRYCEERKAEADCEYNKTKKTTEKMLVDARIAAQTITDDAERKAEDFYKNTQEKSYAILESLRAAISMKIQEADEYYNSKVTQADEEVEQKWAAFSHRMDVLCGGNKELRELIERIGK